MIKNVFRMRSFEAGVDAAGGYLGTWFVVKLIELGVPYAERWDLLYVLLAFIWFWIEHRRGFFRAILPLIALALAVAEPAVLLSERFTLNAHYGSAALAWFAGGCVLMLILFGLRGGFIAITLNALGVVLGVVAAIAVHAGVTKYHPAGGYYTMLGLCISACVQAALIPAGLCVAGWAVSKGLPDPAPSRKLTSKEKLLVGGAFGFVVLVTAAIVVGVVRG